MINRLESVLYKLIFWGVVPVTLFLIGWWSSIGLDDNQAIFSMAFAGMGIGILIDALILKPKLKSLETLKPSTYVFVFVFYSIMTLGFFMGVPAFNLFLGILAGRFMARVGLYHEDSSEKMQERLKQTAWVTTLVFIGVCIVSALIALIDPWDTAINLQGMLGLPFTVTPWMVWGLVIVGGTVLVILHYVLTLYFGRYAKNHVAFDPKDPFYRPVA